MSRIARAPPVVGLAAAMGFGAALIHVGVSLPLTLLPSSAFLLLLRAFHRPGSRLLPFFLSFLTGALFAHFWVVAQGADCRHHLREGQALRVEGRLVGPLVDGRGELRATASSPPGCREAIRVVVRGGAGEGLGAGSAVSGEGVWRTSAGPGSASPIRAGYLRLDSLRMVQGQDPEGGRDALVLLGGRVQSLLRDLYPPTGGLALALVWARKEGLDPEIRDSFARAGTAHLLAISGFHVGVVAGGLLLLLGLLGLSHSLRFLLASLGVWAYVVAIGTPDAALRAALILTVLALGRMVRRAVAPLGALATAFLIFLVMDPGALLRPGFQLSFAGAAGLVLGYRPLSNGLDLMTRGRISSGLRQGMAAGVAATLATLPMVAWHFGRVSLVGIPMTLLISPLVVLAIPGIFLTLLLHPIHPGLARFLARGVELDLQLFSTLVRFAADLPLSSVWVSRTTVVAGSISCLLGFLFVRLRGGNRGGGPLSVLGVAVAAGLLVGPPALQVLDRGVLELVALDVGQGDAILLRSPGGSWILVDTGPRTEAFDAGARTVLPYLRRRGIRALDLLVLTHPDMDHVGGAASILGEFPVSGVVDPGMAVGSQVYLDALEAVREQAIPWRIFRAGDSVNLDGMALRVLAPESEESEGEEGANAASIVLEVRFGSFGALLTGDAPVSSEAGFLPRILSDRIQVLKVGHHGSSTSTASELLERIRPEAAVISVGRRNRYGHPHQDVLDRLARAGARIFRTDRQGTVVVRARKDGSFEVEGFAEN